MRNLIYILSFLITTPLFSQFIDVTNVQRTGNFAACGGSAPNITAQIITSTGSTVENGALVITDPCGYTTLRVNMQGLRYNQPSANWPHGFFFPTNANITVSNVGLPAGWIQMDSVTGASCSAQETGGVGFYYDGSVGSSCSECWPTTNDGNPSNNYGQSSMSCSTSFSIMFDMTFCNSDVETTQTQFTLTGKSDGNTGCWSSPDVQNNTVTFTISTVATDESVFEEEPESPQVITECTNGTNLNYIAEFTGSCGNGSEITWWTSASGGVQLGTGSPFYYDPPGGACPQGLIFYAQCCPEGTQCDNRVPVVVGQCVPPADEPVFAPIAPQCPGGDNPLPDTSIDGSTGTWSPAFDPNNSGTYTFTPDPGQCATLPVDVYVEILPSVAITFAPVDAICQNSTPPDLPDPNPSVNGTWSPAVIDTGTAGTFQYTFTPTDACSEPVTIDITIQPEIIPQFALINNHYCQGEEIIDLPSTSDNGFQGIWVPAQIDTSVAGTITYTFTPSDEGCVETFSIDIEVEELIIPTFDDVAPLCQNDVAPALPDNHEGLTGTWSPSVIDTSTPGTFEFTFTPDRECSEPVTIEVNVEEFKDPQFVLTNHYCSGTEIIELPTTSDNGFEGTWSPAAIDTSVIGTTTYTFTPSDSNCFDVFSIDIVVEEMIIPTFDAIDELCQNSPVPALPDNHEGLTGTWSPAVIDTSTPGTFEFTFTPDRECSEPVTIEVVVNPEIVAEFALQESYCQGETPEILSGTSVNGVSGSWFPAVIDTSNPGIIEYTFTPDDGQCSYELSVNIEVFEKPVLNTPAPIALCDDNFDNIFPVNLTGLNSSLGGGPGVNYSYFASQSDLNNNNPIPDAQWTNYQIDSLPKTIYITGTSEEGCVSEAVAVTYTKGETVEHNNGPFEIEFCEGDSIDLTDLESQISGLVGVMFEYYNNQNNAENGSGQIMNPDNFHPNTTQDAVYVRIESGDFCPAIVKINLIHNAIPDLNIPDSMLLCEGDEFEATATSQDPDATFVWTLPDGSEYTGPTLLIDNTGSYSVVAISERGCESDVKTLTVSLPAMPTITDIQINGTTIVIGASNAGQGPLEYSLDGVLWQSTNQFTGLIPGETYMVWIRSAGCMIARQEVTILLIPNFISPNGDGMNDVWTIRGLQSYPGASLKIFDRYGKIFVDTSFNGNYQWNGKYMGRNVASGDYWYIIHIPATPMSPEQKFSGNISVRNQ